MKLASAAIALNEVIKVFKKYVYFKDNAYYLILGLFTLLTYCFRFFDAVPYFLIVGPSNTGKTLILDILQLLCHRGIRVEDITEASLYHFTNQVRGVLLIDDMEDLARRNPRNLDLSVLRGGYKKAGGRLLTYKGRPVRLKSFGPKVFANIGGIWNKALMSRCIEIKTLEAEGDLERFSTTLHGKSLRALASEIASLFKRKNIQKQIELLHRNFLQIPGLARRDLELWTGMLILAQLIDSEGVKNMYNHILKIAIATIEKRNKNLLLADWDEKFLLSLSRYVSAIEYDGTDYLVAEDVAKFVIDDVKPPFNMRTESLGRKLDNASLIERRPIYIRDGKGNLVHKTGWIIDVKRLNQRVAKYKRILPSVEEFEKEEKDKIVKDPKEDAWENLTEEERRRRLAEVGKPDWAD